MLHPDLHPSSLATRETRGDCCRNALVRVSGACLNGFMSDDLFEHETEATMTREQAAARLRALADALERQNSLRVVQDGRDVTISVPDTVEYELEVEAEPGGASEIEVSISW